MNDVLGLWEAIISIHALREEGDVVFLFCHHIQLLISIHALREEGDLAHSPTGSR